MAFTTGVNVVTHKAVWANGVFLRAVALPGEAERVQAGRLCWRVVRHVSPR